MVVGQMLDNLRSKLKIRPQIVVQYYRLIAGTHFPSSARRGVIYSYPQNSFSGN